MDFIPRPGNPRRIGRPERRAATDTKGAAAYRYRSQMYTCEIATDMSIRPKAYFV